MIKLIILGIFAKEAFQFPQNLLQHVNTILNLKVDQVGNRLAPQKQVVSPHPLAQLQLSFSIKLLITYFYIE